MGDNLMDDVVMDLDLNQEPLESHADSGLGLGSIWNELETAAHDAIEERIRQLEAVTARARQGQRWRQARNVNEISNVLIEPVVNVGGGSMLHEGDDSVRSSETVVQRSKGYKRDSSHLVAKALAMDSDVKRVNGDGGSFFDCNICLKMATEPILTCCGHLFCWACFYRLPYANSTAKECPVCKGEVTDTNITPIYGNGHSTPMSELEGGLKLPSRPLAHRVESIRQQRVIRGVSHIPVAEALRRIRTGIGAMGEPPQERVLHSVNISSETNYGVLPNREAGSSRSLHSHPLSGVASLTSFSSALNNAERLVEDLETYIQDRLERSHAQFLLVDGGDPSNSSAAGVQVEPQNVDSTAEINSTLPFPAPSGTTDVSAPAVHLENLTTDAAIQINLTASRPSSSSRRGSGVSRVSNVNNEVSRESRRRR
ncbi:unnamed protein product [Ilex paraguariensis]|uniref:E3 ubiquitin-protein ligase RMA n=1 Tax=Ilex paraguariensis TaxID=185542 RepID=A0ABC8RJ06_9AQUA